MVEIDVTSMTTYNDGRSKLDDYETIYLRDVQINVAVIKANRNGGRN